jgi:hypothetical protein
MHANPVSSWQGQYSSHIIVTACRVIVERSGVVLGMRKGAGGVPTSEMLSLVLTIAQIHAKTEFFISFIKGRVKVADQSMAFRWRCKVRRRQADAAD